MAELLKPISPVNTEMIKPGDRPAFDIYLLGTDDLGRDIFARMMQGAWVSLTVGFVAVGISILIGVILGGLAGYYGNIKIKFMDVLGLIVLTVSLILFTSGQRDLAGNSFLVTIFPVGELAIIVGKLVSEATVILIIAIFESTVPSLTLKVKLSEPLKLASGV